MSLLLFLFMMYWLPTLLAAVRHAPSVLGVFLINFFLGWTVIGWFAALALALTGDSRPQVIVIENGRVVNS